MPRLPELVLILLGGGVGGVLGLMPGSSGAVLWGVSLRGSPLVGWGWFVNSGREHLVAIREVKLALAGCSVRFCLRGGVCGVVGGVVLGLVC